MLLVAVVGTACADVTTSAIEVNGESIGRGELTDLIVDLRSPAVDEDPVAVDCVARDTGVEVTVLTALVRQELERRGAQVTEDDRQQGSLAADQQIDTAGNYTEDAREPIIEFVSMQAALDRVATNEGLNEVLLRAIAEADVSIDSRFGSWVDGQFVPLSPCF